MIREICKIWAESTYGVFGGSGSNGTGWVVVELTQANPYSVRPKPIQKTIRGSSGANRVSKLFSTQTGLSGNLNTLLYPSQAAFFMKAATDITTTPGDLQSYTIDHYIQKDDTSGTVDYTRHVGCKIEQAHISGTADDVTMKLELMVVAQKPVTITSSDFPVPASTDFPAGRPYCFTDTATGLTLGTLRADYAGFDLTIKNILDHPFFETQYIGRNRFCGRDVTWSDKLLYKSAADRTAFEATTPFTCSAVLAGTPATTFTLQGANFLSAVDDSIDYSHCFYQDLTWVNCLDQSSGLDLVVTVA